MSPKDYDLSTEAKHIYQQYQRELRKLQNDKQASSDIIGHLAKAEYYVLRIALCIHLLVHGNNALNTIDADIMRQAVKTCKAFTWMHWKALQRITGEEQWQTFSDSDIIREFARRFSITNQSALARLLGKSQQYINKIFNKKNI